MKYEFRNFKEEYYDMIHRFLVELSEENLVHINWNWARFEWMYFHPEFDRSLIDKIGLWFMDDEIVGVAIYDHYMGEAFFAAKMGHEELEQTILDYVIANFQDENGIGLAVNDEDTRMQTLLTENGFLKEEHTENILELPIDFSVCTFEQDSLLTLEKLDIGHDLYKHHELLWKGFDHEGETPVDEETMYKQERMLSAPHLNTELHVIAKKEKEEYVSYCGLWYDEKTDYVYVEPVCTIPKYRKMGSAKKVLLEALQRAHKLGAKRAFVISDDEFYKKIGFKQHSHFTFYWYKQ